MAGISKHIVQHAILGVPTTSTGSGGGSGIGIQHYPIEVPDGNILEFTFNNVWIAKHIAVYVNGLEQDNIIDVDVDSLRQQKKILFITEAPPLNSIVSARYDMA